MDYEDQDQGPGGNCRDYYNQDTSQKNKPSSGIGISSVLASGLSSIASLVASGFKILKSPLRRGPSGEGDAKSNLRIKEMSNLIDTDTDTNTTYASKPVTLFPQDVDDPERFRIIKNNTGGQIAVKITSPNSTGTCAEDEDADIGIKVQVDSTDASPKLDNSDFNLESKSVSDSELESVSFLTSSTLSESTEEEKEEKVNQTERDFRSQSPPSSPWIWSTPTCANSSDVVVSRHPLKKASPPQLPLSFPSRLHSDGQGDDHGDDHDQDREAMIPSVIIERLDDPDSPSPCPGELAEISFTTPSPRYLLESKENLELKVSQYQSNPNSIPDQLSTSTASTNSSCSLNFVSMSASAVSSPSDSSSAYGTSMDSITEIDSRSGSSCSMATNLAPMPMVSVLVERLDDEYLKKHCLTSRRCNSSTISTQTPNKIKETTHINVIDLDSSSDQVESSNNSFQTGCGVLSSGTKSEIKVQRDKNDLKQDHEHDKTILSQGRMGSAEFRLKRKADAVDDNDTDNDGDAVGMEATSSSEKGSINTSVNSMNLQNTVQFDCRGAPYKKTKSQE